MLKQLRIPLLVNLAAVVVAWLTLGIPAAITILILTVLEVSFSFDNAVVNAKILGRMDERWQRLFLTVGIIIAVFGMRLVFPLVVVALAAHINPLAALHLAIQDPVAYAHHLHAAHGSISAFGGMFLLMLFLTWLFEEREHYWLPGERRLQNLAGNPEALAYGLGFTVLGLAVPSHLVPIGFAGLATHFLISRLDGILSHLKLATAGLGTFLYLEVLDASFSFDGVIGAFAITKNIFLIALGLGIGAAYIRGMTVYLVRKGTLSEFIYLEHGAHWAIGVLAALLLASIHYGVPEVVTGLLGVAFIGAAFIHSIKENKHHGSVR